MNILNAIFGRAVETLKTPTPAAPLIREGNCSVAQTGGASVERHNLTAAERRELKWTTVEAPKKPRGMEYGFLPLTHEFKLWALREAPRRYEISASHKKEILEAVAQWERQEANMKQVCLGKQNLADEVRRRRTEQEKRVLDGEILKEPLATGEVVEKEIYERLKVLKIEFARLYREIYPTLALIAGEAQVSVNEHAEQRELDERRQHEQMEEKFGLEFKPSRILILLWQLGHRLISELPTPAAGGQNPRKIIENLGLSLEDK